MPSGPKKRKAAKKKQVKGSNSSSSTAHSHQGESGGVELSSPAAQDQQNHLLSTEGEVEKHEDTLSQNECVSIGSNKKTEKEEEGNLEIGKGPKSRKSHDSSSSSGSHSSDDESHVFEKNVVVLESTPVVDIVQPIESLPEKKVHEVEVSAVETSVKPADSLVKDKVVDETSLVPEFKKKTFVEQTSVVNGNDSKDHYSTFSVVVESSSLVDTQTAKPPSTENTYSESRKSSAASTFNGVNRVNEPEALQYYDKQSVVSSAVPQAVQTTSWKGCCGILELFSISDR